MAAFPPIRVGPLAQLPPRERRQHQELWCSWPRQTFQIRADNAVDKVFLVEEERHKLPRNRRCFLANSTQMLMDLCR